MKQEWEKKRHAHRMNDSYNKHVHIFFLEYTVKMLDTVSGEAHAAL